MHSIACLINSTCNPPSCIFFPFWKFISSLVKNYGFPFGNKVKLKAFNAKQSKNILKDVIRDLK